MEQRPPQRGPRNGVQRGGSEQSGPEGAGKPPVTGLEVGAREDRGRIGLNGPGGRGELRAEKIGGGGEGSALKGSGGRGEDPCRGEGGRGGQCRGDRGEGEMKVWVEGTRQGEDPR